MKKVLPLFLALCTLLAYYIVGYLIERADILLLLGSLVVLFSAYFYLIEQRLSVGLIFILGLAFRGVFSCSFPSLSQDIYRFIWDGSLTLRSISPYAYTPNEIMALGGFEELRSLYSQMGPLSAGNYSNYPMLNQLMFAFGASVEHPHYVYRFLIVLADIIAFGILLKLIQSQEHKVWALGAYFLNPLVIIEGTHNLHFEPLMVVFFLSALYALKVKRPVQAGWMYAASVLTKLMPLMLIPLLLRTLGRKPLSRFGLSFVLFSILLALLFVGPQWAAHWGSSIGLWFSNFEFNPSIYRIYKEVGRMFGAYDDQLIKAYGYLQIIGMLGWAGYLSFRTTHLGQFIRHGYWILIAYLITAPTVHPWYLITLVALAALRRDRIILLWSATIFISYAAYGFEHNELPLWLVGLEYLPVLGYAYWINRSSLRS